MIDPKFHSTSKLRALKHRLTVRLAEKNTIPMEESLKASIAAINKELRQRTKRRWQNTPAHLKGVKETK